MLQVAGSQPFCCLVMLSAYAKLRAIYFGSAYMLNQLRLSKSAKMPACSTLDLIYEVYIAITSIRSPEFTLDQLISVINENRDKKGEKRKVSSDSVQRILRRLWLPFGVRTTLSSGWAIGTGPIRGIANVWPETVGKIIADGKIDATSLEISKWLGLAEEPTTHKAYVCYPYYDDPLKRSVELLILLIHIYPKAKKLFVPMTPHEKYWQLEERSSRDFALSKCKELMKKCDFLLYCLRSDDTLSFGMEQDIAVAKSEGLEIVAIENIIDYYPNIPEIMRKCGLSEFSRNPDR
jgi:hypothetical protein